MSLACGECNIDMRPSESLPGKEGTMVHPVLMSLVYLPLKKGISYKTSYIEAPQNRSLCFECIERKLPDTRKETLKVIYNAYESEINFGRVKEAQKEKWSDSHDSKLWLDAYHKFEERLKTIQAGCIFCGNDARKGKPFFRARVIDRVYSEKNLSWFFTNYSWSNMKEGTTSFDICFDDFRSCFPKNFEQLSYDLVGKRNPNLKSRPNELYISPEFEEAFKREGGSSLDEFLDEEIKKGKFGNGKIIIIRREE